MTISLQLLLFYDTSSDKHVGRRNYGICEKTSKTLVENSRRKSVDISIEKSQNPLED